MPVDFETSTGAIVTVYADETLAVISTRYDHLLSESELFGWTDHAGHIPLHYRPALVSVTTIVDPQTEGS